MNSYRIEPLAEDDWQRIAALRLESLRESSQWFVGDLHDEQTRGESEWRKAARESFWSAITCDGVDVAIKCMFRCFAN